MKVIIGDNVDNNIFLNRYFEGSTSEVMCKLSQISNCLIDVGCNIGYYSCLWGKLNRNVSIHSIDPNPQMIERTKENMQLNGVGNYTTYNYGVGSEEALLKFYLPQRRHSLGSFVEPTKDLGKIDVSDVQVRKLKDIICLDDIDNAVLKIDAEGFEWEILSGISATDATKFNYIIFEFSTENLKNSENSDKDIFAVPFLKDYQIYRIISNGSFEPFSYIEGKWYSENICLVRKDAKPIPSCSKA